MYKMQTLDLKQDYFTLFGLDLSFDIDAEKLHSKQQRLQSTFHPDRFVNTSDEERRLSVQQAAWINQAYETLSNPVERARYMLQVKGVDMSDESKTTADTEFLMEQIGFREEMDECHTNPDPLECCEHIVAKLRLKEQGYSAEFKSCFDQGDLNAARQSSRKMQFIQRVLDQLIEFQFEFEEDSD
ncbi:MAG: Fe-S protein assembly co-chaperone HscB [Gammaproteobacteria bacterium]